jgi:hypothetical protein
LDLSSICERKQAACLSEPGLHHLTWRLPSSDIISFFLMVE